MRECLNCEKQFEHAAGYLQSMVDYTEDLVIPSEYVDQYCSFECYLEFESKLEAGLDASVAKGLLDTNGAPIAFEPNSNQITPKQINQTIASLIRSTTKET